MNKNKKEQSVGIVTIKDAQLMTEGGRKVIAEWLRHQADMLIEEGNNYSKRFTARYICLTD
jgi:hypothetical protein